ncbi:hypothetical protein FB451DRAFT_1398167 [Mycena latifolia]|nr:hypothetical protein FB451DRAFT_1398167 [Mycena latifolia]
MHAKVRSSCLTPFPLPPSSVPSLPHFPPNTNIRSKPGEKEEDSTSKIWERDRNMALSGRLMDDAKRNKMIAEATRLPQGHLHNSHELLSTENAPAQLLPPPV